MHRGWVKKLAAFCNTKKPGFRKALLWAAKVKEPVSDSDLVATQWEQIATADTKLYDLLVQICTSDP